jgi:hypothetical protein
VSDDSFANAPVSITELRADRTGHAKDMTARDAVVAWLRDIDAGKLAAPDFVIICFARRTEGGTMVNEYAGGPHTSLEGLGLLERCKMRLHGDVAV